MDWDVTSQSVADNTSNVRVQIYLVFTDRVNSTASKTASISINGSSGSYSYTIGDRPSGGTILLGTRTVVVPHNSDGSKTVSLSASTNLALTLSGTYYGTISVSGTPTLDSIPRASTISSVTSSVAAGSAVSVSISRKVSTFTHRVRFSFGSSFSYEVTGVATSSSYTIPLAWLAGIPNQTSGTGAVTVWTYSGSTQIGSPVTANFTLTAPASVVPTIGSINATRVDNDVPTSWGIYVQNHSGVRVQTTGAAGIYGSTIKSYRVDIDGTVIGTSADVTWQTLTGAGTRTVRVTVTDSRGRSASTTTTIGVWDYSPVTIQDVILTRGLADGTEDNDGTYGRLWADFDYVSLGSRNVTSRLIEYRVKGQTAWTSAGTFNLQTATPFGGGSLSTDLTYEVRITVGDTFGSVTYVGTIGTSFVTMDFLHGGEGIAFGKVSETPNLFESNFPAQFNNGIVVEDWQTPTLLNGWTNYNESGSATSYGPARFYKDPFGVVHLSGLIKGGTETTSGQTVMTLPAGYRPSRRVMFAVITSPNVVARVDVLSDGSVTPNAGTASTSYLSLDGISFRAT